MAVSQPPDGTGPMGLSPAEHLAHAHAHAKSAGVHADLALTHLMAAHGGDDGDGSDGTDGGGDRAMPVVADPPQAGYAQNRTGFRNGTGAARAYRQATGRKG